MQGNPQHRPLAETRRRAFLTIRDLAQRAKVSTKTIVDIEHGRSEPQLRTIKQISEALNVDPLEIEEFALVIEGEPKKAAAWTSTRRQRPSHLLVPGEGTSHTAEGA